MKKILFLGVLLSFAAGCSSQKDNVAPSSTTLDGQWQLTKITVNAVLKDEEKVSEDSFPADVVTVDFKSDGKVKGQLPFLSDLDSFLFVDLETQGFDYRYEVTDNLIVIRNRVTDTKDLEKAYFKLSKTENSMTWTMDMNLAKKSANASEVELIVPLDEKDLDNLLRDFEMKWEFKKK
ncbi:hypothetical protein [Dyadobacter sp. LHD-138]|uniref:hypothetical protein n=1 Tax=Dyadobacter sp. LHD-138 TaxID=3071413 RepID=UPI0027E13452|nr:hypothetical protein [Dyadobacter sp. LHD-138]MDQ6481920.1 hypothetical protein [Dyadobacter sp. LHD-138]